MPRLASRLFLALGLALAAIGLYVGSFYLIKASKPSWLSRPDGYPNDVFMVGYAPMRWLTARRPPYVGFGRETTVVGRFESKSDEFGMQSWFVTVGDVHMEHFACDLDANSLKQGDTMQITIRPQMVLDPNGYGWNDLMLCSIIAYEQLSPSKTPREIAMDL